MKKDTFKFKNRVYKLTDKWEETCLNDSKEFQMMQYKCLLRDRDYNTVTNRINNQIMLGYLEEISYI